MKYVPNNGAENADGAATPDGTPAMPDPMPEPNPAADHTTGLPEPSATVAGSGSPTEGDPGRASHIGGYPIQGELGRGGMGVVYRAEDPRLRREVALKVLLPQFAADPEAKGRFLREARAQARVEHDHVAAIHQVAEHDGVPYLVMPLLKGMTLHAALKANPRPPLSEVVRIGRETAEGLAAAHDKGLVHRDIKPTNVWLEGEKRRVKILDFGLARVTGAADDGDPITGTGAVLGTPAYMSPEQAKGQPADHRSDLFSLGIMLYQMSTGQRPFVGPSAFVIMTAVTEFDPPPVRDLVPAVPPPLGDLITRLLAKNPADRPPSAHAVAEELRHVEHGLADRVRVVALDSHPAVLSGPNPDPFAEIDATEEDSRPKLPPRPVRSSRWLWPAVGLVALAGTAAAVWVATRDGKKPEVVEQPAPPKKENPKPKDKPAGAADRRAADVLREYAGLTLLLPSGEEVTVERRAALPGGPFALVGLDFWATEDLPADFTPKVLLPAVAGLTQLRDVYSMSAPVTAHDLEKLADSAGGSLRFLTSHAPLNDRVLDTLKRFPKLDYLGCWATDTGDDVLVRLGELKSLRALALTRLGERGKVGEKGMAAVAALPLRELGLWDCPGVNLAFCKLIGGMPDLELLNVASTPVGDAEMAELVRCPKLAMLQVGSTNVTAAALPYFREMKALKSLDLTGSAVTLAEARKIKTTLPGVDVSWGNKSVRPKKP